LKLKGNWKDLVKKSLSKKGQQKAGRNSLEEMARLFGAKCDQQSGLDGCGTSAVRWFVTQKLFSLSGSGGEHPAAIYHFPIYKLQSSQPS
jgi:hypothetical protein